MRKFFRLYPSALILPIGLLAAALLWGPGMVNTRGGGDSPFLLSRTLEMAENLRHGAIPPRWMAHAAYDLGYPFFNYYAALPYYLSGGLTVLGLSPLLAIQATQTLGFVLAALTMALWADRIFKSRWAVALSVAAYTFAPFHLVNVYVRGDSLSEFYAFVWYPLILWALDRVVEQASSNSEQGSPTSGDMPWGRVAVATLAYAALILTHNVSALIFSPFALLYALLMLKQRVFCRPSSAVHRPSSEQRLHSSGLILYTLLPFLLGILLTAWFWLPAIAETGYGQLGPEFTEGYFHYENHFRGLDLVQRSVLFDYSVATSAEEAGPFAMGLVQAALALLGGGYCVSRIASRRRTTAYALRNTHYTFLLSGFLLSTLMITPLSRLLWNHLPLLATTQFPWRFLSVQALFTAALTGALGQMKTSPNQQPAGLTTERIPGHTRRTTEYALRTMVFSAVALLCMASALLALHPDRLPIADEDVTWDNLLLYEAFTGNIGTTIRYEYLPRDVRPRLYISEAVVEGVNQADPITDGDVPITSALLARSPNEQRWWVEVGDDTAVAFPLNWWPGWQGEVDGEFVSTRPTLGSGRLALDLTQGAHIVVLRLRNTPLRMGALILSILVLLVGLSILVTRRYDGPPHHAPQFIYALSLALLTSLLLPALFATSGTLPDGPATFFDFVQMPYPHRGPIDFGVARLETVEIPTELERGADLAVDLTWTLARARSGARPELGVTVPTSSLTATLALVSPAQPRHNVPYTLAETRFPLRCTGESCTLSPEIAIPEDLPRGLYLLELRLHGPEGEIFGRTEQGRGMGPLYAGAVRVAQGPPVEERSPLARLGNGDLELLALEAEQLDPTTLRPRMSWTTVGTPRNWSLSLRLLDATGRVIHIQDLQPGYGYLPTTLWNPGERMVDEPLMPLPEGLAPGEYTLRVVTYLEATLESGGEVDLPITLDQVTHFNLRDACCQQVRKGATILCEAGGLALTGLELPEALVEGEDLDFYAEWNAVEEPDVNFGVRWTLLGPENMPVAESEGVVAPGSRTSTWPRHAWVRTPVHIDLPPVLEAGSYQLQIALLEGDETRATCTLPPSLPARLRERTFTLPDLAYPQEASFGDLLRLGGYDYVLSREEDTLSLTLWWQARAKPQEDYKRFVHLYHATTGAVPVQDDSMPRDWTYPTSWWVADEVVSETVTLDLEALPPGEYRIGVGWYHPETAERLSATDASGQPVPDDRVALEDLIYRER